MRAKSAITDKRGEGSLDTAITILISIILGALLLTGLYTLFNSTILPSVTDKIIEMFDYAG
jgi:hypothetical protein